MAAIDTLVGFRFAQELERHSEVLLVTDSGITSQGNLLVELYHLKDMDTDPTVEECSILFDGETFHVTAETAEGIEELPFSVTSDFAEQCNCTTSFYTTGMESPLLFGEDLSSHTIH